METVFYCAKKTNRKISQLVGLRNRIYKAARQCGYLQNLDEPIDPSDANKVSREKLFIYVLVAKANLWAQ